MPICGRTKVSEENRAAGNVNVLVRVINASRDSVFRVFTEPKNLEGKQGFPLGAFLKESSISSITSLIRHTGA
ncbi:MAG: hypothetical protein LHV68_06640 [Elusimicrobia bacterium]|nr:hypothetical protein [Candidatus Liberimonas magnetica]